MPKQTDRKPFLYKLEGHYLIPHELLHVLAYRIIGKPSPDQSQDEDQIAQASVHFQVSLDAIPFK